MTETDADGVAIRGTDGRESDGTDRAATTSLVTDSAAPIRYVGDESVVDIATGDLQDDIERVTGHRPAREHGLEDCGERAIVVGTYGVNDAFDRALEQIFATHESGDDFGLEGPESYLIAADSAAGASDAAVPFDAEEVLLIAGSDPRGTPTASTNLHGKSAFRRGTGGQMSRLQTTTNYTSSAASSGRVRRRFDIAACSSTTRISAFASGHNKPTNPRCRTESGRKRTNGCSNCSCGSKRTRSGRRCTTDEGVLFL